MTPPRLFDFVLDKQRYSTSAVARVTNLKKLYSRGLYFWPAWYYVRTINKRALSGTLARICTVLRTEWYLVYT